MHSHDDNNPQHHDEDVRDTNWSSSAATILSLLLVMLLQLTAPMPTSCCKASVDS